MRRLLKMLIIIAIFAPHAFAGQVVKVGFVDIQKALEGCNTGIKAKAELKDLVDKRQIEIDKLSAEIENLQKILEGQIMLSDEKKKEKESIVNEKLEKYQRLAMSSKKEIGKKEAELTEPIIKKIREIIDKIGVEEGYSMILERNYSSILYGSEEVEITDLIIKKLDEFKE